MGYKLILQVAHDDTYALQGFNAFGYVQEIIV